MSRTFFFFILLTVVACAGCHKNTDAPATESRSALRIEFHNMVGSDDIRLNTGSYTNSSGETYSITSLQYFISNINLQKIDGSVFTIPQDSGYFLIKESGGNSFATVTVPEGEYKRISFIVGVDSARSAADISKRSGVLNPGIGTYWNENQGYIFLSLEGQSPDSPNGRFRFQVGGYGGKTSSTFNNIKLVAFDLDAGNARTRAGGTSILQIKADISKVFTGTAEVSISAHPNVGFEAFSTAIADNYQQMFSHLATLN